MDVGILLAALSSICTATASISETKFVKRRSQTNPPVFQDKSFAFSCVGRCASSSTCRATNVLFADKKCYYYTSEELERMTDFKDVLYQKVLSNVEQTTEMYPPVPECQNGGKWSDSTKTSCECPVSFTGTYCERYWDDCSEGYRMNILTDGVYTIQPRPYGTPFEVYCYMVYGGRTSVQKQSSGINFTRNWQDYTDGFGTPGGDHWLGLEKIKAISDKTPSKFVIRFAYINQPTWKQIICNNFSLSDAVSGFRINFTSTSTPERAENRFNDVMTALRGARFSTYDRDNDENAAESCSQTHKSGWWFRDCALCNPNGKLKMATDLDGIFWEGDSRGVKETAIYLGGYVSV
ncbi:fibrinogen beta chain-like [Haliotis rubra]|uniref:fibrinogen beta chain-like n=1 Tax=Haliotis rubra TaxID=36100 RepID=UPI001EE59E01|nr:fibrinogen beta chain-like [Haliotis rubra]